MTLLTQNHDLTNVQQPRKKNNTIQMLQTTSCIWLFIQALFGNNNYWIEILQTLSFLNQTKLRGYEPNLSRYDFNIVHGYNSCLIAIGTDDPFFIDLFLHNHHITLCKGQLVSILSYVVIESFYFSVDDSVRVCAVCVEWCVCVCVKEEWVYVWI